MTLLDELDVSNVYIYVGDAVRWDALPEEIDRRGTTIKTVSASIHTPTSFASIMSGRYLPTHGVKDFSLALSQDLPSLLTSGPENTAFVNSINRVFNTDAENKSILNETLGVEFSSPEVLDDIASPFVFLERGRGGHAPYGDFEGNGWEYFADRGNTDTNQYEREYHRGVAKDRDWFFSRIETLANRDMLDDTLVIYTSDHGELLGERGLLGHNGPIHPKLAYVPTVFIHPELDDVTVDSGVFRHIDLLPTVESLLERESDGVSHPGVDISSQPLADLGACYYAKTYKHRVVGGEIAYESVWDDQGGHSFATSTRLSRLKVWLGKLAMSPKRKFMLNHVFRNGPWYLSNHATFNKPSVTKQAAREYLKKVEAQEVGPNRELQVDEEQLRDLGYMS